MLQRVNKVDLKPIIQNHPILARIITALILPLIPLIILNIIIWENQDKFISELKTAIAVIFLPWNQ